MSGSFPTSPGFVATNFKINNPAQTSETFNGKIRRVGLGVSFYSFTVKFPPMPRADAGPVIGFLANQYGMMENFTILLPVESYPVANYSFGSPYIPTVDTAIVSGAKQVTLKGMVGGATVLKAGDYFKFNNHTKVYMCTTDCVANDQGKATLYFAGSVMKDVASNVQLTVKAVPFTVMLASDVQEYESGLGRMINLQLDMREDIQPL